MRAPGRGKGGFLRFLRGLAEVRRERYEVALVCSAQWRMALAVALTGAPVRIAQERRRNRRFLTHALPPGSTLRPILEDLGQLLVPLGIEPRGLAYRLEKRPLAERAARLRTVFGEQPLAVLHPFASDPRRCVAPAEWVRLAADLERRGFVPLWIGSPGELARLRASEPSVERGRTSDRACDGGLTDTAAAISLAALFVGHDSGPLHVAGSFGVPSLGVFAPGHPERTFPQGIGPARMLARAGPAEIRGGDLIAEVDLLLAAAGPGGSGSAQSPRHARTDGR